MQDCEEEFNDILLLASLSRCARLLNNFVTLHQCSAILTVLAHRENLKRRMYLPARQLKIPARRARQESNLGRFVRTYSFAHS